MILESILEINPDAKVVVYGDSADNIEWHDGTAPISKEDILAKHAELQAEYDAQEYARNRKAEYDMLNQFEMIGEDSINGTTSHKDAILAIKAKYPKS